MKLVSEMTGRHVKNQLRAKRLTFLTEDAKGKPFPKNLKMREDRRGGGKRKKQRKTFVRLITPTRRTT